ncbi:RAS1 protein [Coemansia sp. RSA 2706]|nr:RAS1 protein [Coemansia sp. RSA 2706]KAJ2307720.1 RAS1 protein [Coemansia sp. RSA 2705]KAJ2315519.1 RAS1 protein [Coemansia sp. RSA 2704]KAJ2317499.1 RAS1 protein [Coemansia sp. RSA 2702]KAJ2364507.1 RAS1 protein [Coemansia sp. RSA 2610]KAJ2386690.1 RAS1 protein [Coemansia sp. RSA 2611]KAJ2727340.1 RAS1 protein [Coemansia sp. Cherry 401B]
MSHMIIPEYKIVMLGSGGVGKSMLTTKYMNGNFSDEYDPTIEDSYRRQCTVDGDTCVIEILDTAGQEEYAAMQDHHIRSGDCFVVVYSVADRQTLNEAELVAKKVFMIKDTDHVPIVLVGNKCDLAHREVTTREGMDLARRIRSGFYEASARNDIKVDDAFAQCIRRIKRFRRIAEPQSATLTEETNSRNSLHLKYNKGLGGTKSWIAGLRANRDKTTAPITTHQSLPERYMGGSYTPVTIEKRHRSNTETSSSGQPVKRRTAEPQSPKAKRRSTTKASSRSRATTPKSAAPAHSEIRVVPLGNDRLHSAYGEFGIDRTKPRRHGHEGSSHSSKRQHGRHTQTQKRGHEDRSVNVNKDLPRPQQKKTRAAPACIIL